MQNQNDEIEIQHRIVIEDEEVEISDLPKEIRTSMRDFNAKLKKYEDSGDADLFYELQQDDVAIANNILTWIEDNESEEEEEDEDYLKEEEEAKAKLDALNIQAQEKAKAEAEAKAQAEAEAKAQAEAGAKAQAEAEAKAKEQAEAAAKAAAPKSVEEKVSSLIKDGVIGVVELEQVLGREPNYPNEKVGNIKLRKQYLRPFYEVV